MCRTYGAGFRCALWTQRLPFDCAEGRRAAQSWRACSNEEGPELVTHLRRWTSLFAVDPALTHWANFLHTSGAGEGTGMSCIYGAGFRCALRTQRLRTGLTSYAPPVLRNERWRRGIL